MKGNPRVIEYLNKALTHELTAVNQYWLHYRLLDDWGFTRLAKKERAESIEEMQHADKLVVRIIFLEEVLECDLKAEYSARALYMEARAACRKEEDYVTMDLFEELLADEEGHINYLETQLNLLKDIGIENYGQLNAHSADELPDENVGP
jgi:bacterioferritin